MTTNDEPVPAAAIDLMEALKASIDRARKSRGAPPLSPVIPEPNCQETRFDTRGDCDGNDATYVTLSPGVLRDTPAGYVVTLCGSHARMAGAHNEIRKADQ